jgi:hypothetical protein
MPIARSETVQSNGEVVPIYFEVDALDALHVDPTSIYSTRETRENAAQKVITVVGDVFSESIQLIRDCAEKVAHGLAQPPGGPHQPHEVELQLAIKVDATLGVVLAKISPGALMQVTLRWRLGEEE